MRRAWRKRAAELLLWIAVAVATALVLVLLSDQILPTNF